MYNANRTGANGRVGLGPGPNPDTSIRFVSDDRIQGNIGDATLFFYNQPEWVSSIKIIDAPGISGTIPEAIGKLTKLTSIKIWTSMQSWTDRTAWKFSGPLPASIARLTKLTSLEVYSTYMAGTIPTLPASLTYLHLQTYEWISEGVKNPNRISGVIAPLFQLPALQTLKLTQHQISGTIPAYSAATYPANLRNMELYILPVAGVLATALSRTPQCKKVKTLVDGGSGGQWFAMAGRARKL